MQDWIEKLSLREVRLALIGLGAVVSAAVIFAFVVPKAKLYRTASADAKSLVRLAVTSTEVPAQLIEQRELIETLRQRLDGEMVNMPIQQVEAYVIGRLQRVSWDNSVELVSVAPGTGEKIQIFQEILFDIELVGRYEDLYHWLLGARDELGFFVIKEFAMRRNDAADNDPMLLATLSLASYRAVE